MHVSICCARVHSLCGCIIRHAERKTRLQKEEEARRKEQKKDYAKWCVHSAATRVKCKIGRKSMPLAARKGLEMLNERMQDCANVVYIRTQMKIQEEKEKHKKKKAFCEEKGKVAPPDLSNSWVDITQAVHRVRPSYGFSPNHRAAVMYSLAHDFCAPGSMHMASLGWPRQHQSATGFGNNEVHESVLKKAFTGQGMSLPCLTTCLCAYVLNRRGPWWKQ